MKEYTTLKISPAEYNAVTKTMSSFGWAVRSANETYSEQTNVSDVNYYTGIITTSTTVTNFVSVFFERDTEMEHYSELRELEKQYIDCMSRTSYPVKPKKFTVTAIIATIALSIFSLLISTMARELSFVPYVILPVGVALIILKWVLYHTNKKRYLEACSKANSIETKARAIRRS